MMSRKYAPTLWPDMEVRLHQGTETFRIGLIVRGAGQYWGLTVRHVFGDLKEAPVYRSDGSFIGTFFASDNVVLAKNSDKTEGVSQYIVRVRISEEQVTPENVDFDGTWPRDTLDRADALGATVVSVVSRNRRIGGVVETEGRVKLKFGAPEPILITGATFVRLDDPKVLGPGLAGTLVIADGGQAIGLGLGTVKSDRATELVVCPIDKYLTDFGLKLWAPKGMKWSDTGARLDLFRRKAPFEDGPDLGRAPSARSRTDDMLWKTKKDVWRPNKIARFLEVSNDIYRNGDDARFADQGGEIIYCLDSTTFGLFYDTAQWRQLASSFHSLPYVRVGDRKQIDSIATQASLIAAEHLLGTDLLPGARNNTIHLTPWHRAELASHLREAFDKRPDDVRARQRILQEVKLKIEVNRLYAGERSADGILDDEDALLLNQDIEKLKDNIVNAETLELYKTTRIAASVLAATSDSERLDQIHRLVSDPLCRRIKSLTASFPTGPADIELLRTEAAKWYLRIQDEANRRTSLLGQTYNREVGAIWSDARSLATLRWVDEHRLHSKQRLVFVTGDSVLFGAYRRWWADVQDDENKGPFLLRRPFQYTPLCNLSDAQSDLAIDQLRARIGALFSRIQEVIEIALSPFNLAYGMIPGRGLGPLSIQRGREDLALRMSDRAAGWDDSTMEFFTRDLPKTWLKDQESKLDEITGHLRELERIGIGFFRQKIRQRLADEEYLADEAGGQGISAEASYTSLDYWERSLEALSRDARSAWLPKAKAFLVEGADEAFHAEVRVPKTVWYRTKSKKDVYELVTIATKKQRGTLLDSDFEESPEAIFVIASVLALQRQLWWKADEFAYHAARAAKGSDDQSQGESYWECLLLQAQCKRFRIGAMPWQTMSTEAQLNRRHATSESMRVGRGLVKEAEEILETYLEAHSNEPLHVIRGLSERAALRLFTAVVMHQFGVNLSNETAESLLKMGQVDLGECLRLDRISDRSPELDDLRRHFLHNAAASDVIRFLFEATDSPRTEPTFAEVSGEIAAMRFGPMSSNSLLFAEQTSFQILCGKADASDWPAFERAIASWREAALTIDSVMLEALSRRKDELFDRMNETLDRLQGSE